MASCELLLESKASSGWRTGEEGVEGGIDWGLDEGKDGDLTRREFAQLSNFVHVDDSQLVCFGLVVCSRFRLYQTTVHGRRRSGRIACDAVRQEP